MAGTRAPGRVVAGGYPGQQNATRSIPNVLGTKGTFSTSSNCRWRIYESRRKARTTGEARRLQAELPVLLLHSLQLMMLPEAPKRTLHRRAPSLWCDGGVSRACFIFGVFTRCTDTTRDASSGATGVRQRGDETQKRARMCSRSSRLRCNFIAMKKSLRGLKFFPRNASPRGRRCTAALELPLSRRTTGLRSATKETPTLF